MSKFIKDSNGKIEYPVSFFVYILKYGKAIPGELSRYIESGDKLYDLVEQEMV